MLPSVAETASAPAEKRLGVRTEVSAINVSVRSAVKVPAAGVLPPIVTLLMAPPVSDTLPLWNWPPAVRVARTTPLVPKRRSAASLVPR